MSMPRPACGEYKGYGAHKRRNEEACQPCKDAAAAYERKRSQARRDAKARGEVIPGPGHPAGRTGAVEHFLAEVEFLASCGAGWGRICAAFRTNPAALEQRLTKNGRPDLAARIFGTERYDITQGDRHRAKAAA